MSFITRDLRSESFRRAYAYQEKFLACDLRGADLFKVRFERSYFQACSMRGANLRESHFCESEWDYTNLEGADLRKSNFQKSRLQSVDLSGADLRGANFSGSGLYGVNFAGADLRWVDFSDCSFLTVPRLKGQPDWRVGGLRHVVNFRGARMPDLGYGLGNVCVSSWSGDHYVLIGENQEEGWIRVLHTSGQVFIFPWYHKLAKFVSPAMWEKLKASE